MCNQDLLLCGVSQSEGGECLCGGSVYQAQSCAAGVPGLAQRWREKEPLPFKFEELQGRVPASSAAVRGLQFAPAAHRPSPIRQPVGRLGVPGNGMTVRRPGQWTPAAWVLLLAFLVSPSVCTFSGPFPGPDKWADIPPATRRVSPKPHFFFGSPGSLLQQTHHTELGRPWLAVQTLDGREVVYTLPARPARGVVVVLHGHMQRAYEWGFSSATCPNCTGGLPCGIAPVCQGPALFILRPGLGLAQANGWP